MKIVRLELIALRVPFAVTFRHAGAERSETLSIWTEAEDEQGNIGYGEGCPRSYVTGEDLTTCRTFFDRIHAAVVESVNDLDDLRQLGTEREAEIDHSPSCWCAIESAVLDLLCRRSQLAVEDLLGLPAVEGSFRYTAVIGDQSAESFEKQLRQYVGFGFEQFKIKLSRDAERDRTKWNLLNDAGIDAERIRVDANNLWQSCVEAVGYLGPWKDQFRAIEEPIVAREYAGLEQLARELDRSVILDESFLCRNDFSHLQGDPDRWIVNLRVSKLGGIVRTLQIIEEARSRGIRVIVGAQVGETSLLTRLGITAASAARDLLVGHEGAFGTHLLQHDVVEPPLMFGPGGRLNLHDVPYGRGPLPVSRPSEFLRPLAGTEEV
ncbi:enolase C-terminal domain-like protein [Rubinisphaera margarita]|uniref:enolase C-terminal domain-like protein n=1 Tax=Rubinisphaera margarita TaxID=2909586 RepID=UPI001EE88343|nr:enolase C-terminal domain-like protein [Rubinisphaera margarita]MCG6158233.1 hypothetical protein [Rubinisphaera margarita]